ncbi:unnamed protein product, partial [Closterium sp. NIES-54]
MYALTVSAEGDCYLCVPPNPGIEAAALGASESALPGTAPAKAFHTFTLDSGASRYFFPDSTTVTPLPPPVAVRLADPSGGPVLACSSTVLPCPPVPSGSLSGLHLPSFSTKLVSTTALQDAMVTTTTPGGQRVSICTCTRTDRHLATFTHRPGSSLYTLTSEPPQVTASGQVSASGPVAVPCSCCLVSHQTLLWHHRLGHPSMPRLRGMHSRLLVSGLPRSLPPLPPLPAPPCLPCVEGRQRAAPHSSSFPLTTAPLQTLHMDMWGLAHIRGVAERRIGLVMEVARTSMIHAAAPHFLWPFAVRYAAHQLNLWPRVSLPETSPALRWTGEVGNASVFWFYHPTLRHVLPSQDVTFDESFPFYRLFPYRTTSLPPRRSSSLQVPLQKTPSPLRVSVDSSATRGAASGGAASGGAEPERAEPGGAEAGVAESEGAEPGGAEAEGVEPRGNESRGAEPRGTVSAGGPTAGGRAAGDTATGGTGAGGAGAAGPGGAGGPAGAGSTGGAGAAGPGGSHAGGTGDHGAGGAAGTRGAGGAGSARAAGPGGARAGGTGAAEACGAAGTRGAGGAGAAGPGGARTRGTGAAGAGGAAGPGAGGAGAGDPGAAGVGAGDLGAGGAGAGGAGALGNGAGGTVRWRPFLPHSPLSAPSPYTEQSDSHTEPREPESHPASPVCAASTSRRVPRPRPPLVPGTHPMALPLFHCDFPCHLFLPTIVTDPSFESTTASALFVELVDFAAACRLDYAASLVAESESVCPSSIGGECALGTDVLEDRQEDFECLAAAVPHLVAMLLAPEGDPDALDIPTPRSYAEAITGPYSSKWQIAMDAEMASWTSTCTYVDAVPPPGANIVDGMSR